MTLRKNVASQKLPFALINASTGAALTGATVAAKITLDGAAQATASGSVAELANGQYVWSPAQADTNANSLGVLFTATGAVPVHFSIYPTAADPTDAVRLGLTALPNANAEASGGLGTLSAAQASGGVLQANAKQLGATVQTGRDVGLSVLVSSGTGTGQLDVTSGVVKANLAQILGTALTETSGLLAAGFKKFFNVSTPTGTVNSIPDAVAGAASGLAIVGSNMGTVTSVTGAVGSVTAGVTVTTNNDKTGYGLSAASVQAIWDALTSALTTVGSIGKLLVDNINATISSRSTYAGGDTSGTTTLLTRIVGTLASGTHNPQSGDAYARLGAPAGASVSADVAAVKVDTAAILDDTGTSGVVVATASKTGYALSSSGVQAVWDALTSALTTSGSIGKWIVDKLDVVLSTRLASSSYTTPPTVGTIADQVWEEALADHSGTSGSAAAALNAAGSAGDPWNTALPGAYGSGTAGKILGDNLDATVSSRATQTSVDDLPTNAELATALGTADDAVLAAIAALNNLSQANIRTAVGLGSANLDTQLDALPTNAELATALAAADDAVLAAIAALNNLSQANVRTALGMGSANLDTQLDALPTNAELATALAPADDAVLAAIAALNNLSAAQVNAEAVDALSVDTYAEPGAVPAATASLKDKIGWLTMLARNRVLQTSSEQTVRNDGDSSDVATAAVSDDATTFERSKWL